MSKKAIILTQLQSLATTAKAYISGILTSITNAITEVDNAKADKPVFTPFTISSANWALDAAGSEKYPYSTVISAPGMTVNNHGKVTLSVGTLASLESGILCPGGDPVNGGIKLWATAIPEADISGVYEIISPKEV